jgi:hypothetical protein
MFFVGMVSHFHWLGKTQAYVIRALPANTRRGWKVFPGTNALAYHVTWLVTKKKVL